MLVTSAATMNTLWYIRDLYSLMSKEKLKFNY